MKLEDIVEHYGTMVATIAHRMIQNREIAKEAAQEVWYEVFKSLPSFNADSELSTWIYTIAKRTISRYAQNEKVATLVKLEQFRALQEIEYSGSDDARLIFIFKENIGLSHKEIGEIMEMSVENVRKIYSRSIDKISHFLTDTCPLYNPAGTCKCRICKHVFFIDLDKEYTTVAKMIRLADLYQKFEKDLPRKNYWEKFLD